MPSFSAEVQLAVFLSELNDTVEIFLAKVVLLSTGGLGQVYLHTTNPVIATGDGVAMSYRAGAKIANMEFIQFHPTTLHDSGSPSFLITEAVRGFGGILKTHDGEEFMHRYDKRKSLAPRDIVAYAMDTELKKRGEDYVLLDLRHLAADQIKERFPNVLMLSEEPTRPKPRRSASSLTVASSEKFPRLKPSPSVRSSWSATAPNSPIPITLNGTVVVVSVVPVGDSVSVFTRARFLKYPMRPASQSVNHHSPPTLKTGIPVVLASVVIVPAVSGATCVTSNLALAY